MNLVSLVTDGLFGRRPTLVSMATGGMYPPASSTDEAFVPTLIIRASTELLRSASSTTRLHRSVSQTTEIVRSVSGRTERLR